MVRAYTGGRRGWRYEADADATRGRGHRADAAAACGQWHGAHAWHRTGDEATVRPTASAGQAGIRVAPRQRRELSERGQGLRGPDGGAAAAGEAEAQVVRRRARRHAAHGRGEGRSRRRHRRPRAPRRVPLVHPPDPARARGLLCCRGVRLLLGRLRLRPLPLHLPHGVVRQPRPHRGRGPGRLAKDRRGLEGEGPEVRSFVGQGLPERLMKTLARRALASFLCTPAEVHEDAAHVREEPHGPRQAARVLLLGVAIGAQVREGDVAQSFHKGTDAEGAGCHAPHGLREVRGRDLDLDTQEHGRYILRRALQLKLP
mmetsp:Transcript_68131/g.183394  ORF Transcript_68131/g.183394 Transcript_68131/m.183394 type:complete len:315 (-) Transcript_68131:227-1171(-)